LPSRPEHPVVVSDAADRPQPRRDVNAGDGMTVTVGRIREDPILDLRMVALGHNTIRGAAGGSVLNAELLAATGMLPAA
jgi:aspartate-semialdehyde dehydrogenase